MKKLGLILGFILFLPGAFALNVSVENPEPVIAGSSAFFRISLFNDGPPGWFSLSVLGTKASWVTLETPAVYLSGGATKTVKVWVSPPVDAYPASYVFRVIVSGAGEREEARVNLIVKQLSAASLSVVNLSCDTCEPGSLLKAVLELKNTGSRALRDLKVSASFLGRTVQREVKTLEPGGSARISVSFEIPERYPPGTEVLEARAVGEEILANASAKIRIPEVKNIAIEKRTDEGLFSLSVTLKARNLGNVRSEAVVSDRVPEAWYTFFVGPEPFSKNGLYRWKKVLAPGESFEVNYSVVYWPLVLGTVAVIVLILVYLYGFRPVSIKKRTLRKAKVSEGSEFTVVLEIKNGHREAEAVVVRDFVPSMFEVVGGFETKKPVVRKTSEGAKLVWRLGKLNPGEERVLSYKVRCRIGIIGSVKLPPASVSCRVSGKRVLKRSGCTSIRGADE